MTLRARGLGWKDGLALAALLALLGTGAWLVSRGMTARAAMERAAAITGGDPERGRALTGDRGCGGCHVIPGVPRATGLVGPSLERMASRVYIAGVLANSPGNMVRWLQNPPAVDPLTAMPNLHLEQHDARDIAAYLYTLD
jgi:cytochrome c